MDIIKRLDEIDGIIAFIEHMDDGCGHEGLIAIELERSNGVDTVDFEISQKIPLDVYKRLEFVDSDESCSIAWYRERV